jgi:hypothetical protein
MILYCISIVLVEFIMYAYQELHLYGCVFETDYVYAESPTTCCLMMILQASFRAPCLRMFEVCRQLALIEVAKYSQ